jgi:hypothetical protein
MGERGGALVISGHRAGQMGHFLIMVAAVMVS